MRELLLKIRALLLRFGAADERAAATAVTLGLLEEGDLFMIRVLNETLTYEVDQIRIVEPQEMGELEIEEGKDYCTLITCTPYGVNSHRLLVRGRRVENRREAESVRVTADAMQISPEIVAPLLAVPLLLVFLAVQFIPKRRG